MSFNRDLYNDTEVSSGFQKLEPGVYVCRVIDFKDEEDKQYLRIKYDIVEGKFKDYFTQSEKQFGEWPRDGYEIRSYKDSAMPFFKGFITALEKSNQGFDFKKSNYDFKSIINKRFVGIFGEEEIPFQDDNGNPIVKVRLQKMASTERLAQGDIKIPERKLLSDDDRERLEKQKYTDKVVAERTEEKKETTKKVTVDDLVF